MLYVKYHNLLKRWLFLKSRFENERPLQFRQLNVHWTEHAKKKSSMTLIQTLILRPMWSTTKECAQVQNSNGKRLITSTRIFYKNSSASLDCISISDLCSGMDTTVATVHQNFTSQHQTEALKFGRMQHVKFIAWNNWKNWNLNSMKVQLLYYHTTCCSCSYLVNCVHEYFTVTESHL